MTRIEGHRDGRTKQSRVPVAVHRCFHCTVVSCNRLRKRVASRPAAYCTYCCRSPKPQAARASGKPMAAILSNVGKRAT